MYSPDTGFISLYGTYIWSHDSPQPHFSEVSSEFDLTEFLKFYGSRDRVSFFVSGDQSFKDRS